MGEGKTCQSMKIKGQLVCVRVDPGQVVKPGDKSLYPRNYLTGSSKCLYVYHSEEQNTLE